MDYTLVLGVDHSHLTELKISWPTWRKHKPDIFKHPIIIFYDREQVRPEEIRTSIYPNNYQLVPWPSEATEYPGTPGNKWSDPQRHKMLSGFVHVPAKYARTKYWLKLDTDTIATGIPNWLDPYWEGRDDLGIAAHKWGLTKPPYQMMELDCWAQVCGVTFETGSLNLEPEPGATKLKHSRIISWCGIFSSALTRIASQLATNTDGPCCLPVCSQDGYMWYLSQRLKYQVIPTDMKQRGWNHYGSTRSLLKAAQESLSG